MPDTYRFKDSVETIPISVALLPPFKNVVEHRCGKKVLPTERICNVHRNGNLHRDSEDSFSYG